MFCRTSSGSVPSDVFNVLTCSLCYQYLMLHENPVFFKNGAALVAMNSSGLKPGTRIYPDVNNETSMSRVCGTMDGVICNNWKTCCRNAEKCCQRQIARNVTFGNGYCPQTWDGYSCFDNTKAGDRVYIACPPYIKHGLPYATAYKDCTSNGTWFEKVEDTYRLEWTNYSTCVEMQSQQALVDVGLTCNVISLILLFISCVIFVFFRQLRKQQRIRLHICLFSSFIVTAVVTCMWDFLIYDDRIQKSNNPEDSRMSQNSGGCKLLYTLMRYSQTSNYFWMFCEGFYLHKLIVHAFEVPKTLMWYYIYGWGFPWIPVVVYAIIRSSNYELDLKCWVEHAGAYEYIVYVPNLLVVVANIFFFVNILRILLTQLQSHPNEPSNYRRAFRATFVLVPLFGLQWVLVIYRPEQTSPSLYIYEVLKTVLSNSQGTMVSLIFCIFNKEVHMYLKNFIHKHSFGRYQGESHFNSVSMATHYSHVPGENGKRPSLPEIPEHSECIPLTKVTDISKRKDDGNGQVTFQEIPK